MRHVFALALALFLAGQPVCAVTCDDINKLADAWHELADFMEESNEKGVDRNAVTFVGRELKRLVPKTRDLAKAAPKRFGGSRVLALVKQMEGILDELQALEGGEGWDEDLRVVDRLVDVLDTLTEVCDTAPPRA